MKSLLRIGVVAATVCIIAGVVGSATARAEDPLNDLQGVEFENLDGVVNAALLAAALEENQQAAPPASEVEQPNTTDAQPLPAQQPAPQGFGSGSGPSGPADRLPITLPNAGTGAADGGTLPLLGLAIAMATLGFGSVAAARVTRD